jgi:hypothetical protein
MTPAHPLAVVQIWLDGSDDVWARLGPVAYGTDPVDERAQLLRVAGNRVLEFAFVGVHELVVDVLDSLREMTEQKACLFGRQRKVHDNLL